VHVLLQGGLTSAIFDETFGVLLYAAGRYNHLELEHGVFTARLEVDYKKVRLEGLLLLFTVVCVCVCAFQRLLASDCLVSARQNTRTVPAAEDAVTSQKLLCSQNWCLAPLKSIFGVLTYTQNL
jgi:hypothetical protein